MIKTFIRLKTIKQLFIIYTVFLLEFSPKFMERVQCMYKKKGKICILYKYTNTQLRLNKKVYCILITS